MQDNDQIAVAATLGALSIPRLAEFAMEEELIDRFDFVSDEATITQGERRFVLPHRQACTFLIGMLRGRSWYLDDSDLQEIIQEESQAEVLDPAETLTIDFTGSRRNLETTLDALLTFTREVGIINGFEKADDDRHVRIDIPACSIVMSYADALGYLFDCVQHEMRSMTEMN